MTTTVEQVQSTHTNHLQTVSPGLPATISDQHEIGEGAWQGDLGVEIIDAVPGDYELIAKPADSDRQLVPLDGGPGSHHRLKTLDGVTLYRPKRWGKDETDLRGPVFVITEPNEIVHEPGHGKPHGTVHLERTGIYRCRYQRNLDVERKAEIRARD